MKVVNVELLTSWEIGGLHLRIVGRPFSKEEFHLLKSKEFVWGLFDEYACESELPEGWYITMDYKKLEQYGFTFSNDVKKRIDEYQEKKRKADEVHEKAKKFRVECPTCHEELRIGQWSDKRAILCCDKHDYSAVVDFSGERAEIIDQGYNKKKNEEYGVSLFWNRWVFEYGSIERAKAEIMKRKKERAIGTCTICGIQLKTLKDVIRHLKEVHGCD